MSKANERPNESGKPGIKRVAEVAGVSPTTVSRVLNDRGYISAETRDKVHRAMKKINYMPNDIARALLNSRTNLIGMVVPSVGSPFHGQVVEGVERVLSENGFKMLLCDSANRPDLERSYVEMLRRNMVDGIIVGTLNIGIEDYAESGLSLVAIDCDLGGDAVMIASDSYRIGEIATMRLVDDGCQRILCIRNDSRMPMPGNKRTEAYLQIMRQNRLKPLVIEIEFVKSPSEKAQMVYQVLDEHPDVDGIFAGDDGMAAICIDVLRTRGRSIPFDVKVIGVDGSRQVRTFMPSLTTVQQPIEMISELAAMNMIALVNGEIAESNTELPVKLIEGATA